MRVSGKSRHHFVNKGPSSQSYDFSSSPVQMWELDHKKGWVLKNWYFRTVVVKKFIKSPLHSENIKPINPKGNQPWIIIGRTDAEAQAPILWPPDAKSWLTVKDPDAGKDWGKKGKGKTEDKIVEWYHQHSGHEFEQTPRDSEGQGSLARCCPWGRKELNMT